MKPCVSVIVPVYNNECYLSTCIESILNQTLANIEIVLIDDGSTDASGKICDYYSELDDRISVIHKKNEGLGVTRNVGLSVANGEYFTFVDSDDYVDVNMYEKLYNVASKNNAELAICGLTRFYNDGKKEEYPLQLKDTLYEKTSIQNELICNIVGADPSAKHEALIGYSMCMGIYSLDIVKQNNMSFFSERVYKCEDVLFKVEYFTYVSKVCAVKEPFYFYRYNNNSLTHLYREDWFERLIASYRKEFQLLEEYNIKDGRLYADRNFFADVRSCMREVLFTHSYSNSISEYKIMLNNELLCQELNWYPISKCTILKRIFNYMMKQKMANGVYLMLKIENMLRK